MSDIVRIPSENEPTEPVYPAYIAKVMEKLTIKMTAIKDKIKTACQR